MMLSGQDDKQFSTRTKIRSASNFRDNLEINLDILELLKMSLDSMETNLLQHAKIGLFEGMVPNENLRHSK